LMQQAVRHLARKHSAGGDSDHNVGAGVVLPTADLKRLEIRGPDNIGAVFEGDRIAGRSTVRFGKTDRPGVYRVIGTDQTGATPGAEGRASPATPDPPGWAPPPAPGSARPSSGKGSADAPAETSRRVELWHGIAAALLLLLLAEGLLVQR